MFSTDKNVNTLAHLLRTAKTYGEMKMENAERETVDKLTAIMTGIIVGAIVMFVVMIVVLCLSASVAFALAPHVGGLVKATLLVGLFHAIALGILWTNRQKWISSPISKALSIILLRDKALQPAPDAEKIRQLEETIAADYAALTSPPESARNNLERAFHAASRAWTMADGIIFGYKLYKKFAGKRRRR